MLYSSDDQGTLGDVETRTPSVLPAPIVVMGVSGSGKSTVGAALATRLNVPFADADDFHSSANVAKMSRGEPLDDADRYPWLERTGRWLAQHSGGGVIACSALKRRYRDQLRRYCAAVGFLHLAGAPALIAHRQSDRAGHFMPPSLLRSQFNALEPLAPDENGVTVDVGMGVDAIVAAYLAQTGISGATNPFSP